MADPRVLVLPFFKLYINVQRFTEELKKDKLLILLFAPQAGLNQA